MEQGNGAGDKGPGEREIAWMRKWLVEPGGPNRGKPLTLLPHEVAFLRDLFRPGVRMGILSTPRKNRKTTLCAAIVLLYLAGCRARPLSELVSTALSLDQASRIYQETTRLQSPELELRIHDTPSRKSLTLSALRSEYRALSADVKTKLGGGARLHIADELGEVEGPMSDLYEAVEGGMVGHDDALTVIISTQAENDEDLLSVLIDEQLDPETAREDAVLHLYQAPDGCEVSSRSAWRTANPALGVIVKEPALEALAARSERQVEYKGHFRRYHLNQRVPAGESGETRWLGTEERRADWEACAGDVDQLPAPDGPDLFGGLDLSETRDLTCLVWAWRPEESGPVHLHCRTWVPDFNLSKRTREEHIPWATWAEQGIIETCSGKVVDYEDVAEAVVEVWKTLAVVSITFDPWRIGRLKRILESEVGDEWIEENCRPMRQGFQSFSPALGDFDELLTSAGVRHGGHQVLRMGAQVARVQRDPAGSRKLTRKNPRHKIDGIIAAIMSVNGLLNPDGEIEEVEGSLVHPIDPEELWS